MFPLEITRFGDFAVEATIVFDPDWQKFCLVDLVREEDPDDPCSWFFDEVRECGVEWWFDLPRCDGDLARAMMLGVAPGQMFRCRFGVPRYWQDYWGEYDSEPGGFEVLAIEPWSTERVLRAWSEVLLDGDLLYEGHFAIVSYVG